MKIDADQAFALAQQFHELATTVGDFRFAHWDDLSKDQRNKLKDSQLNLLNQSSHLVTEAVGLVLDDAQGGLKALQGVTAKAQKALETIADVKKAIVITASLVKLGASIASQNPAAIAGAAQEAADSIAS